MNLQPGKHLPDVPLQNWQLGALFVPFSLPLLGAALDLAGGQASGWLPLAVSYLLLGLLAATWVVGVVRGFPVWALPALGVLLFLASYALKLGFQDLVLSARKPPGGEFWPETIPARLSLYVWFDLAYVAIAGLLVAILLLGSPAFLGKVRKDWTLLSFLLYGLSISYMVLNDPYRGLGPFELASSLILAVGAALYVFVPGRGKRLLLLLLAVLLAHPVLSLGIYQIFPQQTFAASVQSYRLWEALQPVLDMPALALLLCLPALLPHLLPIFGPQLATPDR